MIQNGVFGAFQARKLLPINELSTRFDLGPHGFLTGTSIVTSLPEIGSKTVSVMVASGRSPKDAGGLVNEGLRLELFDHWPAVAAL